MQIRLFPKNTYFPQPPNPHTKIYIYDGAKCQSPLLYRLPQLLIANLLQKMENKIVVASLAFHQPETIYDFLQKNVGPLFMIIKVGRALLNFPKAGNAETAITKYHNYTLHGMPLRLKPYMEGELEIPLPLPEPEPIIPEKAPQPVIQPLIEEKQIEQHKVELSEFTKLIEESLQIIEPQNLAEDITKKNRREIMEFVNSYAPLISAVTLKQNEINSNYADPEQKARQLEEFYSYYKLGLKNVMQMLKKEFRILKRCCAKYGKVQENIELQPSINIACVQSVNIEKVSAFKNHMQYISPDSFEVKRIAALNQQQIVVTTNKRQGRLAIYKLDDEYAQTSCEIKQGAYGLALLDSHILVSTFQGNIVFFNINDLSSQEMTPRLQPGLIFELVRFNRRWEGYNVVSLGGDSLKIWNIKHEKYTDSDSTLFFQQSLSLEEDYRINTVAVFDHSKLVYAKNKCIVLYDCEIKRPVATQASKGVALKVVKVDQQFIGVANERYLSFVDMRNNARTINYDITKQVKTLTPLSQFTVFYGCMDGQVGVIDRRLTTKNYWRTGAIHKGKIYDICKIGQKVVTGDHTGQLATWIPYENYSGNGVVAEYK